MSSRPPGQDRFTQMSEQAAIIARKKAEIEAKLKAAAEGKSSSSSSKGSPVDSPGFCSSKNQSKGIKNRWGFKGKRSNPEPIETAHETSEASPPPPPVQSSENLVKNQFSNDGSFLEQFRKMKQAKPEVKKVEVESKGDQEEWYKSALERAKQIAQTMSTNAPVKSESSANTTESEYGAPSSADFKPAEVKQEDLKPSISSAATTSIVSPLELPPQDIGNLPAVIDELASMVAVSGDYVEEFARARNVGEDTLAFLFDPECDLYQRYRAKVESLRRGFIAESTSRKEDAESMKKSKRKSRWGDENDKVATPAPVQLPSGRSPQLIQYAIKVFGTTDLEDSQWKQCEDQLKMNQVYSELLMKQKQAEMLAQQGKKKYEYDSDEEVDDGGTWEHKARRLEMEKTRNKAQELTEQAKGFHHIGDFLPPEELTKFMKKYSAIKTGETFVDESDYAEQKLKEDNLGFKMLQRMGWSEGKGLGSDGQGITTPISQGSKGAEKSGLGTNAPHNLSQDDDEFDAYRKRMMLAYRFRPNPLNNPRRAYY